MKQSVYIFAAAVLTAGSVVAQIGFDEAQCAKVWGSPVGGKLNEFGMGMMRYDSKGTEISLVFMDGLVQKASYRKDGMNERDVDSLLRLNNNKTGWEVWTPPGIPASELTSTMWLRDDEGAMANLKEGTLRVVGSAVEPRSDPPSKKPHVPAPEKVAAVQPKPIATAPPLAKQEKPEKQKKPDVLPIVGDSKERVVELLGDPTGIMESNGKEIMLYSWGNIWVAEGHVISIN